MIVLGNLIFADSQEALWNTVKPEIANIHMDERDYNMLSHEYNLCDYQELKYLSCEEDDIVKMFVDAL